MRQVIIVIGVVLAVLSLIYGAILPFIKAKSYIVALSSMSNIHSVQAFEENFNAAFNSYSPIGDEEVTKFLASDIVNLVGQENQPEAVARELLAYIEPHLLQNDPRHLLSGAQGYTVLWLRFHNNADYVKAEEYYKKILAIGPKLPPALYGLLDLYERAGDKVNSLKIANTILGYWPSDENVKKLVQ